eukprot:5354945-Karenia_brevis.AAC.1
MAGLHHPGHCWDPCPCPAGASLFRLLLDNSRCVQISQQASCPCKASHDDSPFLLEPLYFAIAKARRLLRSPVEH